MKLLIKILGQTKQFPALRVDFGPGYTFPWNESLRAYAYEPKSQKDIDDIFASQTIHSVWFFAPVIIDGPAAAPAAPVAISASKEADAEIERLTGLLRSAEATIAKKTAASKADAETIELLRADLKAQQDKAVATATAPAKGKPGRKGGKPEPETAPETDLPADV